jgi:hypothetical protein
LQSILLIKTDLVARTATNPLCSMRLPASPVGPSAGRPAAGPAALRLPRAAPGGRVTLQPHHPSLSTGLRGLRLPGRRLPRPRLPHLPHLPAPPAAPGHRRLPPAQVRQRPFRASRFVKLCRGEVSAVTGPVMHFTSRRPDRSHPALGRTDGGPRLPSELCDGPPALEGPASWAT